MISQDEQIARFVDAINQNAEKKRKKIEKEIKRLYTSGAERIQMAADEQMENRIFTETAEAETEFNRNVARIKRESRQALSNKRNEIFNSVFSLVSKKIADFTQSSEYLGFLSCSVDRLLKYVTDGVCTEAIFLAKSEDIEKVSSILSQKGIACKVSDDKEIILGGIKLCAENKIFDDTFDSRLEYEKDRFFSFSKLTFEI